MDIRAITKINKNARTAAAAGDVGDVEVVRAAEAGWLTESMPCLISGNPGNSGSSGMNPPAGLGMGVGVGTGDVGAEAGDEVGEGGETPDASCKPAPESLDADRYAITEPANAIAADIKASKTSLPFWLSL